MIVAILYWSLYLFKNRLKANFMAALTGMIVLYYVILMAATELIPQSEDMTFIWARIFMLITVSTNLWLLAPSMAPACFLSLPLHLVTIAFMTVRNSVEKSELT